MVTDDERLPKRLISSYRLEKTLATLALCRQGCMVYDLIPTIAVWTGRLDVS
jgi:hypothetical protein